MAVIDVLFESAAEVFGFHLINVDLTGAINDGTQGLKSIKAAERVAVDEDPETAEVKIMPQVALDLVGADYVLPLVMIGL